MSGFANESSSGAVKKYTNSENEPAQERRTIGSASNAAYFANFSAF